MLNIPQVPTDSLYKFMALSGLAMIVIGVSIPLFLDESEANWRFTTGKEEADRLIDMSLKFGRYANDVYGGKNDGKFEQIHAEFRRALALHNEVRQEAIRHWIEKNSEQKRVRGYWCSGLATAGAFLMVAGFTLWWTMSQSIHDRLLYCEFLKADLELQILRASQNGTSAQSTSSASEPSGTGKSKSSSPR